MIPPIRLGPVPVECAAPPQPARCRALSPAAPPRYRTDDFATGPGRRRTLRAQRISGDGLLEYARVPGMAPAVPGALA